jgi:hypothetical protein
MFPEDIPCKHCFPKPMDIDECYAHNYKLIKVSKYFGDTTFVVDRDTGKDEFSAKDYEKYISTLRQNRHQLVCTNAKHGFELYKAYLWFMLGVILLTYLVC